jgi:hypothetical protein
MNMQKRPVKMSLKKGVNSSEKVKLRKMIADGKKAKEISEALRVELSVIEWFMPKPKPKPKKKVVKDGNLDE